MQLNLFAFYLSLFGIINEMWGGRKRFLDKQTLARKNYIIQNAW